MFIEEVGPVDSLKHSVKLTHYHAKQVFMIMAIILGLGLFLNTFITNPLTETYKSLIFPASIALAAVNSIVLILFLLIEAFLSTFEHLFFFYAYLDFEKMEVKNDKSGN